MIYIGIDPGLSGAVGIIDEDTPRAGVMVYDTPTINVANNGKTKRKHNIPAMVSLLKSFEGLDVLVVLENVHSMPSQGVSSSFTFGEGLGIWEGIIATLGFSLEKPSPQRWKKEMMSDMGKEKSAARLRATQLFPQIAAEFSRIKDDGRAEALLMADYGRRLRKG